VSERRASLTPEEPERRPVILEAEATDDPTMEVLPALVVLIGVIMHVCGY